MDLGLEISPTRPTYVAPTPGHNQPESAAQTKKEAEALPPAQIYGSSTKRHAERDSHVYSLPCFKCACGAAISALCAMYVGRPARADAL